MQTIYLDVLLTQSIYVNYFLLRATAKLTHVPLRLRRCFIAAAISSLFSLLILLPPLPIVLQMLCKLAAAAITVTMAFGWHKANWLHQTSCFFCCSFLLAGLLLALCSQTPQGFATWGNSYCYIHFSLLQLILFTAFAYFVLHLCSFLRNRKHHTDDNYQVFLRLDKKTVVLSGIADTGNNLTDPFSGTAVIVCSATSLTELLNGKSVQTLHGYRLIPCTTVTAQGILPLFRPDEVCIRNLSTEKSRAVDAMIGIGGTQTSAIFHPHLIENNGIVS